MAKGEITHGIRSIAAQLDVSLVGGGDPGPRLVAACIRKVEGWLDELGPADTFEELLEIVTAKLRVHFEVIRSDEDLREIAGRYLRAGEAGFATLQTTFDDFTDAAVIRLQRAPPWSDRKYVAVIDARGFKASKEWFSKWHELAHLIAEPQMKLAFRRTQATRRDPVERLMDQIAAELAFYPKLLLPALEDHSVDVSDPTLATLQAFQNSAFKFASLHATLIAILRHSPVPAVLVEARSSLKKSEKQSLRQGTLFVEATPEPKLRAITTAHNPAAVRQKLFIHQWIRIPERSVIHRLHGGDSTCEFVPTEEDLAWWESEGKTLPRQDVVVEAMVAGPGRILALVTKA